MRVLFWLCFAITAVFLYRIQTTVTAIDARRVDDRAASVVLPPPDPSIVIVGLDDAVFQSNRFNRLEHAKVLDNLSRAGARAVFMDLIFDEARGPEFDVPLAEAIRRNGKVVVAGVFQTDDSQQIHPPTFFPELAQVVKAKAARVGLINTARQSSKDKTLLAVWDGRQVHLSASLALYAFSQHLADTDVEVVPANLWHGYLLNVPPLRMEAISSHQGNVTNLITPLYFHPPATGPKGQPGAPGRFPVIPYLKVADGDPETLKYLKDKFVLMGDNRTGTIDIYNTPVGEMKGVEIHAQALDLLLKHKLPRFPIYGTSLMRLAGCLILILSIACGWTLQRQPSLKRCALVALAYAVLWELLVIWGDRKDVFLPQILGELALFLTCLFGIIVRLRATYLVLRTFIPVDIVDQLISGAEIHQGQVEATVMVTDIRGYTTLSESRTPTQVLDLLNDYHTETVTLYQKFGGHVLNYQGDAQIILFGHPKPLKDAPRQAILAAQAASGAVETLRRRWKLPPDQAFNVGAGICTGKVIIADLGGKHREYTVIGELVRKCHKLQSQSQILKANIILDEETFERCRDKPQVEKRENVTIEGLPEPVTVYITDLVP